MSDSVLDLLKLYGPCLTSDLAKSMVESGLSNAAARQRITRAQGDIKRLAGLRFAKNARFIYLDDQYGTREFWEAIEQAFKSNGAAYWNAVTGLRSRGGVCPKSMFPIVCGAPMARTRQLSPERIFERLCAIQLLEEYQEDENGQTYIQFHPHSYHKDSEAKFKATLLAEFVALQAVRDWARKIGFGSFGKFKLRGETELPVVSSVAWDMSAPSYMRPLARMNNGTIKPGFFVCDINLRGVMTVDEVALFIRKHSHASAPQNVSPIMPFLIGDVFSQDAFNLARQSGIAATTIEHLFGADTAKALRDLIELLSNSGATAAMNPAHLFDVLNALTKIDGAANNLRGAVFELVVGSLAKDIEGGYLLTGEKRRDIFTGEAAEIDVLLDRPDDKPVLIVECKSKIPGAMVSRDEVKHWLGNRVPLIQKILIQDGRYNGRSFHFELWSNGLVHDDALSWLSAQRKDQGLFTLDWKDGTALRSYANKAKTSAIRKILKEHYFLHPLAKLKKKTKKQTPF